MGKYSVPENIRNLKPKGSIVKVVHNKYYVYKISAQKHKDGRWGCNSGNLIGYIDEKLGFIPNGNYALSQEITTLEYGQYAIVVNNSKKTKERLFKYFNTMDASAIYLASIIHVVNEFVPIKNLQIYKEQSYLDINYHNVKLTYHCFSKLLDALGRRQGQVYAFEQSLLDDSSKEIAIDGHDIKSTSHENDLAEIGNKFSMFRDMQLNVLMAYDINTNQPLISRTYPGSMLDKISVKDLLDIHTYNEVLFIIDRGFYSKENIELFSQNNNHYIIPLSPNLKEYKMVTNNMDLKDIFVYEKEKKRTTIEYKEVKIDETTKIIVCRDLNQYIKDQTDYLKNMEQYPDKYTKENYDKVKDFFGVIVLQTNLSISAKEIYVYYKKRWKIETFFNYFKNTIDINSLGINGYYATQGMSFIMLIVGLIYEELKEATKKVNGKNVDDCLLAARFVKLNKKNNEWSTSNCKKELQEMMELLNTNLQNPLE